MAAGSVRDPCDDVRGSGHGVRQIVFLIISRDPIRHRPIMIAAIVEKASFGLATIVLYVTGRLSTQMLGVGTLDLILGVLFVVAYMRTAQTVTGKGD
jgi:hypothetical protein